MCLTIGNCWAQKVSLRVVLCRQPPVHCLLPSQALATKSAQKPERSLQDALGAGGLPLRDIWEHPRAAKCRAPDLPERGSGLKTKYQEFQGRISAGSSSWLPPRRGPSLRASIPGWLAQHFPPPWSCVCKPGPVLSPRHGIFQTVLPTGTSYSRPVEQLGSASNSQRSRDAKRFSNSYARVS